VLFVDENQGTIENHSTSSINWQTLSH